MNREAPAHASVVPRPRVIARASQASIRIGHRIVVAPVSLEINAGEFWLITGPNGSGKSLLARLLAGNVAPHEGTLSWPALDRPRDAIELVSFEQIERILEEERKSDMSSVMHGATDPGRTVRAFLADQTSHSVTQRVEQLASQLQIRHILDRGLRFLSTGELRKTLLARALSRDPRLLVIDDPYDGLDAASQAELARAITDARATDRAIVVVANRLRDQAEDATHELELSDGMVRYAGPRREANSPPLTARYARIATNRSASPVTTGLTLVSMQDVSVRYGATPILHSVDWRVTSGEHWMLYGPNGSGKSTLLSLITGDNPKAYGQKIELFGRRKGSGESVAQIKRHIGFVSGDLQLAFPLRTSVLETVLSGFFDTIGLFGEPSGLQTREAEAWLKRLGLAEKADRKIKELSFGQRRLLLIARAVVKKPELLIADEPCQGLDESHTRDVLRLLEEIGREKSSTLLYVTHNMEERLPCISRIMTLEPDLTTGSRAIVHKLD